jgi:hypothetical protein
MAVDILSFVCRYDVRAELDAHGNVVWKASVIMLAADATDE